MANLHFQIFFMVDFIELRNFDNYIEANIVLGRLKSSGINCWLKDENLSALIVDPILTNVLGGIKLMVEKEQLQQAEEILNEPLQQFEE